MSGKLPKHDTFRIAEEIIRLKFDDRTTIGKAKKQFFAIMREHGVTHGRLTKNKNALSVAAYDWTAFMTLFQDRIRAHLEWDMFMNVPRDVSGWPKKRRKCK